MAGPPAGPGGVQAPASADATSEKDDPPSRGGKNYFIWVPFIVGAIVIGLVVMMLLLVGVPVSHTESFSFHIVDPGSFSTSYNQTMVFAHSGTVTFTFNTLDGKGVIFTLMNDTKAALYQTTSSSGGSSFTANAGQTFTFQIFTYAGDTVSVTGSQSYTGPTV